MEKSLSHYLLPNNTTDLLSWNDLFAISNIISQHNPNLLGYAQQAPNNPTTTQHSLSKNHTYRMSTLNDYTPSFLKQRIESYYDTLHITDYKQQKEKENADIDCIFYFSFFPNAESHGIHYDASPIYHWQHLGQAQWTVYENDTPYTYILNPGDCLFIPEKVYHDVLPLTARLGLTFSFFPNDYHNYHDALDNPSNFTAEDYYMRKNKS